MAISVTTAATLATPAACSRDIRLLVSFGERDGAADVGVSGDALVQIDATDAATDAGVTMNKTCAGLGDPIRLPTANGPVCASALATRGGRFALCSCSDLQVTAPIHTDSFDSTSSSPSIGGVGGIGSVRTTAAIGVDGVVGSSAEIRAGGAFYATSVIAATQHIETVRSLRSGGLVLIDTDAHVAGDAYLSASISGILHVDGILHVPANVGVDPASMVPESSILREPVSIPPPCDCGASFVNLNAAVASAVAVNDNGVVGLPVDALALLTTATGVNVTCGVYVLSSIDAAQSLIFAVRGRALVVVTGDVVLRGGMIVSLDPGAELDLLIGGRLMVSGSGAVGSTAPARFRIWVAGTDSVVFDNDPAVGAVIRAPQAAVAASTGLRLSGGLVAGSVMAGGEVDLHFDEAILSAGTTCGEPTATPVP